MVIFGNNKENTAGCIIFDRKHGIKIRYVGYIPVKFHGFAMSFTILALKSRSQADYVICHAFQLKLNLQK